MTTHQDCLDAIQAHGRRELADDLRRPMTNLESQIVYGLFSFATFAQFGRDVMARRNKAIPRANTRLGLIRWACSSLFDDYVRQLSPEGRDTLIRRSRSMQLSVTVRRVTEHTNDGWKLCRDADLEAMASAAWHGTCQYCALKGVKARKCKLRKTLDALQCLEPGDCADCWYKAMD